MADFGRQKLRPAKHVVGAEKLFSLLTRINIQRHAFGIMHSMITKRGQTIIPRQVRDALHLQGGERITYEIRDEGVLIKLHEGILASLGALKPSKDRLNVDFKEARKQALEVHTKESSTGRYHVSKSRKKVKFLF